MPLRKILLSFGLILTLSVSEVNSQSRTEELDKELRKELGQEKKEKQTSEKNENTEKEKSEKETKTADKKPDKKESTEKNPVLERYDSSKEDAPSLLWILLKVFFVLAVLVGVFYYLLRLISRNRNLKFPVQGAMRVLSTLPLGPNKELQLVEVSGMLVLVGVTDNSISLIKEIDSPEIKQKIFSIKESFEPPKENFLELIVQTVKEDIQSVSHKKQKIQIDDEHEEILDELKSRQLDRLEKLKKERQSISKKKD